MSGTGAGGPQAGPPPTSSGERKFLREADAGPKHLLPTGPTGNSGSARHRPVVAARYEESGVSRHTRRRSKSQVRMTIAGAGILASAAVATTVAIASAGEVPRAHEDVTTKSARTGADHAVFVQGNELAGNTI